VAISKLKAHVASATERAGTTVSAARRRSTLVDTAFATYERDRRAVGSVLAGAVAFRLFVYLLPLFLAILTLVGILVGIDDDGPGELGEQVGMSAYVIDSVETAAEQSSRSIWVLVPLAVWAIYTAGLGAAKVLRAVHALAWDQPIERLRRGPATTATTFLVALAAVALVGALSALRERSAGLGFGMALLGIVPFAGLWLAVSLLLPRNPCAGWTALLPGALLVGVCVWAIHLTSVYWMARRVQNASELFGSLGVAAALLAWLYLMGRLMVASAMLNASIWERRHIAPVG
jgi:uncharacterized BrkB/YihY/UPF0761 family membrane protein